MAKEKKHEVATSNPKASLPLVDEQWPFAGGSLFDEMDYFFNRPSHRRWWPSVFSSLPRSTLAAAPFEGKVPLVNLLDKDDSFLLEAELPGVKKEDIKITISPNDVSLEACTSEEKEDTKADYYHKEIASGSFKRSISLPAEIKEDDVKATFENGLLKVTLPKLEKVERKKVKVG